MNFPIPCFPKLSPESTAEPKTSEDFISFIAKNGKPVVKGSNGVIVTQDMQEGWEKWYKEF